MKTIQNNKTLADKVKEKFSPYQYLSKKYNVHVNYVYNIACGQRKAIRGKAFLIKQELEKMTDTQNK